MGCCIAVPQNSVAMIEQFGRFDRTGTTGFNCLNPICGESLSGYVSLRVQQIAVSCETKSSDNVFVTVVVSVQYRADVDAVYDAFYKLQNPQTQIKSYVFDVVRSSVPKITLDRLFEVKEDLAHSVRENLGEVMQGYGYEIIQTLVIDIEPAKNVCVAMNEINANERLRVAAADVAEANKIRVVKAAEADAESKYLQGVGIARQRKAIVEGMRESVLHFSNSVDGANAKTVMDLVLVTQYFDTLKDLGKDSKSVTVFVPHSPGSVSEVAQEIRAGI